MVRNSFAMIRVVTGARFHILGAELLDLIVPIYNICNIMSCAAVVKLCRRVGRIFSLSAVYGSTMVHQDRI
jgi:hypothetical protein